MRKKIKTLAAALVLVLVLALGSMPQAVLPSMDTAVEVQAAARKLTLKAYGKKAYVGKTAKIHAKATKGARLTYRSSNKKVAAVSSKGVVTGKKAGTARITITAKKRGYRTVKKTITVKVYRQGQKVTAKDMKLTEGQSRNLKAKAKTSLTYKSSNQKVVTVDRKGKLKAVGEGTAKVTITAKASGTYNQASRTIRVTVNAAPEPTEAPVEPETPAPEPTTAPDPTETPENPEPTATPEPTETPAPEEPVEPSEELKAALDEITSKDYEVFKNWGHMDMVTSSPFYFVTDGSDVKGGNVCRVASSDPSIARVVAEKDENGIPSILEKYGSSKVDQSVTLTFTLGSYVKTCKLSVVPYHELDISGMTDEELVPYVTDHPDYAQEMFQLINDYREKNGLNRLEWEEKNLLYESSVMAGYDMLTGLRTQNSDDFAEHGRGQIGFGYLSIGTPQMAFDAFISSPMHRTNILNKRAKTMGVAFMTGYMDCGIYNAKKGTSVVCTINSCTSEKVESFSYQELVDNMMVCLDTFFETEDEFHKYESWFYNATGSNSNTDTEETLTDVGGDDFSDGDASADSGIGQTQEGVAEEADTGTEDLLSLEEDSPDEEELSTE